MDFNSLTAKEKLAAIRARNAAKKVEPKTVESKTVVYTIHATGDTWKIYKEENELPRYLSNTVIYMDGEVYISNEILKLFGDTRFCGLRTPLHFGRRGFFRLSDIDTNQFIQYDLDYERRSSRERAVQERNKSLASWLRGLNGNSTS